MLPSTGFFKGITCPFFESGLCERPYCHYRHVRRDSEINSETIENNDILKQLVSEAVKKVLLQSTDTCNNDIEKTSQSIITQVVQELNPTNNNDNDDIIKPAMKATYNPTPIAQLNKMNTFMMDEFVKPINRNENRKHIPVPYTPHRPSRTPLTRVPAKLNTSTALTLSVQKACATNSVESHRDKYTPSAVESENSVKYLPGSIADNPAPYSPAGQANSNSVSYIPSNLSCVNEAAKISGYFPKGQSTSGISYTPGTVKPSSSNSYCPTNNSTLDQKDKTSTSYVPKFNYKPTPLPKAPSPTFSSDEDDEPNAKKSKLNETEDLADLDMEFEMLGEILEDESNNIKKASDHSSNKTITTNNNKVLINKHCHQNVTKITEGKFNTVLADKSNTVNDKENDRKDDSSSSKVKSSSHASFNHESKSSRDSKLSKIDHKLTSKQKDEDNKISEIKDSLCKRTKDGSFTDTDHSSKIKDNSFKNKDCSSRDNDDSSKYRNNSSRDKDKSFKDKDKLSRDKDNSLKDKDSSSKNKERSSKDKERLYKDKDRSHKFKEHSSKEKDRSSKDKERLSKDSERSSKDKERSNRSKESLSKDNSSKKSSSDRNEKYKISSSCSESRSKESVRLGHADQEIKHKSSSHNSQSNSKSLSKSASSSKREKSKLGGESLERNRDKRHKSTHSTSKDLNKSRPHSKSKSIKEVDLFTISISDDDNMSRTDSLNSDVIEVLSESDEETITQECMKIFEEYVPTATAKENTTLVDSNKQLNDNENVQLGKKRVAHNTNITIYRTPNASLPNHKTKAIQMVTDRCAKIKQFHNERLNAMSSAVESSSSNKDEASSSNVSSGSKVRIAHVPYASNLFSAKKALPVPEPPKVTPVQTVSKGSSRIAHMPNEKFCDRPTPLEPLASKVPINIRSKYLNMMIDDCLKLYLAASDAYERALHEELLTNKKCTTVSIYKNSALLTISRLRKEFKESGGQKISNGDKISHSKVMLGKKGETVSWSIENKYKKEHSDMSSELKGSKFYDNVYRWILSEQELRDNGFPRPHPDKHEKGCAKIYTQNTRQKPPKGFTRCCNRCKKEYDVDKKGFAIIKEECIYHPNKKYKYRGESKYQCCSQDGSSDGCLSASTHVFEYVDHDNLRGFVTTLPKDDSFQHGLYALDCEMCYTTNGLDLTRVTVIDSNLKVVYESLVKPLYPIIDYNTNFSGITEEQMKDVTTSLLEVQATLLHLFSNKTILVGHSLESDFKALKLIHNTVVDTSVLFPHKMGPPYKRALRNLTSEYLKKIIQNSIDGHDSAEDALVCMELVIWKLKEELKTK